jgi:uncharacterized protein (TIGR02611 family)
MRRREQVRAVGQRVRATRTGRITLKVIIALIGGIVVTVGIILIPFPGPGWLIVVAGLAIWAVEFVWARRLLHFTRTHLERWWHWLGRQHWSVRALAGLAGLVFVTAVVWGSLVSVGIDPLDLLRR